MDAPRLALRFRELTPSIDTIQEHRKILSERGQVLWGWWKKTAEETHDPLIADLRLKTTRDAPTPLLLVNASDEIMYRGAAIAVLKPGEDPIDFTLCPGYYANLATKIPVWFALTRIDDTEYDERVAETFGDNTLLEL